jgi:hypothetical protein
MNSSWRIDSDGVSEILIRPQLAQAAAGVGLMLSTVAMSSNWT